ncbi:MAG: hypothetical protein N3D80_01880 [Ignavibacterium album]|jgi:hypothetical protein|uniref:hypothetical protein n=1 Tax=Ignavibacterium album TaxID=591197 RepID=UPI0026E98365|nr:hypothetical protein [Ignavibacterium album]MCX8104605.1 hypothetical protein [Ignavibacterium album]
MKTLIYSFITIILLLLVSCSSSTDPNNIQSSVQAISDSGQILIINFSDNDIYFAAFESNMAAVVNWSPLCNEENKVRSNSSRRINFSEIECYPGSTLKTGDRVIIYYWQKSDGTNPEVHSKVVIL